MAKGSSREAVRLASEKVIEGLPNHLFAIICFVSDPAQKADWTVARTWWGTSFGIRRDALMPAPGDYRDYVMKIALAGEELPGQTVSPF